MSLRFAIIKQIRTRIGKHYEDIVFEYPEKSIVWKLWQKIDFNLALIRKPTLFPRKYEMHEIQAAFNVAWKEVVEEFKDVSVTIY